MLHFIRRNPIRVSLFAIFLVLVVAARVFDVGQWINIHTFEQYRDTLIQYVAAHYWQSVAIFISVYAIENIFALPFSFVLSIAAGFLYGVPHAVVYIVIGATSGAVLSFVVTRYVIGRSLQRYYRDTLTRFNRELDQNGIYYLIILRLIPIVPFFLVNILSGLTRISLLAFTFSTAAGIIPGSILYASAGYHLRTVDAIGDIFTWDILIILVFLVVFALSPVILKKWYGWRPLGKDHRR